MIGRWINAINNWPWLDEGTVLSFAKPHSGFVPSTSQIQVLFVSSLFPHLPSLYLGMVAAFIPGSIVMFTELSRWKGCPNLIFWQQKVEYKNNKYLITAKHIFLIPFYLQAVQIL
jgi:hypothetical protein